jgi:3-hydroxymyristoyl/3-hydroxydecanoyl-(acyl carrier protein) dehydratase
MSQVHRQFVADQSRMHEDFLRLPFGSRTSLAAEAETDAENLPSFSRTDLEALASGKISAVFGPMFAVQDDFTRQVRMPEPPLLLADRVTGIDAVAGSMETGRLWSETDVSWESWYLNSGYMPAGIMIEAGQADLLLISWLGADFLNRGERVYRLLGCDLTYYGGLPRPGDTLTYEIHVDGHADHDGMRIFFFHSECRINGELRQTVKNGQAGFFSEAELERSAGILWTPESDHPGETHVDAPAVVCAKSSFSSEEVRAFSESRVYECFGAGFERAQTHICTPKIQDGRMLLIEEIPAIDLAGGPWQKGYLRARLPIAPDTWFFDGHFKDDPCMPGTLMFEGCLQAMSFYLAYCGYSLDKDGWRFEAEQESQYDLRCRGQVTPESRELVYEVFVREVHSGPEPRIEADVLCTVDGLKAFHARKLKLKLRRDWPLSAKPEPRLEESRPVAVVHYGAAADGDVGFAFGEHAILANGLGSPEQAFGALYRDFEKDRGYGFPRLPAPPFLFLTRLASVQGEPGISGPGLSVEFEYDIRPEDWYFAEKGTPTLPLCAMVEIALQPCVWISAYMGIPQSVDHPVQCRNLGGTATWLHELPPDTGTLTVRSTVTGNSLFGGTEIQNCDIECFVGDLKVFEAQSVSGNFTRESLQNQAGLSVTPEEIARAYEPSDFRQELAGYGRGELLLPDGMLLMAERITGFWPAAGRAGLGRVRAEKDIRPDAWYFKAHFPNDPVQPGSLGLEAIVQTLKFYILHNRLDEGFEGAHFEPIALDREFSWKYRGQILHTNRLMTLEAEILRMERDESGVSVFADAWIWIDGKRIYEAKSFGMRVSGLTRARPLAN